VPECYILSDELIKKKTIGHNLMTVQTSESMCI